MLAKLEEIKKSIFPINNYLTNKAYERIDSLTKPKGSLGRLEELAAKLFAIFDGRLPSDFNKAVYVFAADHGVTEEGVSAYPKEVTYQMVYNFLSGGAAINVFARAVGARVFVVDVGVDHDFKEHKHLINKKIAKGTKNFAKSYAMSIEEAVSSILVGFYIAEEAIKRGYNLIAPGDMGIGNTTASSAILSVVTGYDIKSLVGTGTGIDERTMLHKQKIIENAIFLNAPQKDDPIDVLMKVGGLEIGAICGFILGAAYFKRPVVVDGFISSAGFILAYLFNKNVKDYAIFSHCSMEKGHRLFFDFIQTTPLLDLNLRLGEGTGAALAFPLITAASKMFLEMATFSEASVSEKLS